MTKILTHQSLCVGHSTIDNKLCSRSSLLKDGMHLSCYSMIYSFSIVYIASRANGENGCVKFAEIATQTVNLTNLLTNLDPHLANCNIMSASFLDHISISALATSPPATSALCWNNSDPQRQQQQQQRSDSISGAATNYNNHNNNNFSTINNNNNNLNNVSHTHNNNNNSRRSSSDAIATKSQAIGWILGDATVPRSNSCSSTSNNRRFNNSESIDKEDKCQSDDDRCELMAIPSIDDTSAPSPAHSGTDEVLGEHTKINQNDGERGGADDAGTNEDSNGDAAATSENAKTIADGINGPTNNSCL